MMHTWAISVEFWEPDPLNFCDSDPRSKNRILDHFCQVLVTVTVAISDELWEQDPGHFCRVLGTGCEEPDMGPIL